MSPATVSLLSFFFVGGATFLAGALLLKFWPAIRRERLEASAPDAAPTSILRWGEGAAAGWQRSIERLGVAVGPRDTAKLSKYRERLGWAGYHDPRAVRFFIGAKVALALVAGYAYTLYGLAVERPLPNLLPISVILGTIGLFLPDFWLRNRTRARQREIVNALPDALDLLMVCVEAGMAFDAAVIRVSEQPEVRHSPLHQEMLRMHLEIRAGRPRQEALRAFGERTGVEEVQAMVGTFIQAERLGTPVGKALRVHAETARVQRRHRAEERAHLAPLKMIFPTVFFLMPSFFLVALAPSLLTVIQLFQSLRK